MSKKITLKVLKCPTCGASLKAENTSDSITCLYCGNSIIPVAESTAPQQSGHSMSGFANVRNTINIENIKTSSSALACIEYFFNEYDWDSFIYSESLTIPTIDKLANSLKFSATDDKITWFVCFKSVSVPFIQKISGCKKILSSIIEEYKKESLEAYSKFEAYVRISSIISTNKTATIECLKKFISYAIKYGASSSELDLLNSDIDLIENFETDAIYQSLEQIPEINIFNNEKNVKIKQQLAEKGVDAEAEYVMAKSLIENKNYVGALNILQSLNGYSDSKILIEKIDKYFLVSDVLEIEGNLYYFSKENSEQDKLSLYSSMNGKICDKPLIKNISNIITNFADIIYYLDTNNMLRYYNLSLRKGQKLLDKAIDIHNVYFYNKKSYFICKDTSEAGYDLMELDLATGSIKLLLKKIKKLISCSNGKIAYSFNNSDSKKTQISVLDLDVFQITAITDKNITINDFFNNFVVYTCLSPNKYNKNLYIKALNSDAKEILIESNILDFSAVVANKLFYYIGSPSNKTLININLDGTERKELPAYISKIVFEQNDWLYFIRRSGYNSVLCKSRLDGSEYSVIAADIEEFIDIINGYLYYINDYSDLVKVRMDGSNYQKLCNQVEKVLSVKEDRIIFISIDDKIASGDEFQPKTKIIKSIYAVNFTAGGKIKLAYNILEAERYDDNTIYYIVEDESNNIESPIQTLYKIDVDTHLNQKLLEYDISPQKEYSIGFIISVTCLLISIFFCLIGFAASSPGLTFLFIISTILSTFFVIATYKK